MRACVLFSTWQVVVCLLARSECDVGLGTQSVTILLQIRNGRLQARPDGFPHFQKHPNELDQQAAANASSRNSGRRQAAPLKATRVSCSKLAEVGFFSACPSGLDLKFEKSSLVLVIFSFALRILWSWFSKERKKKAKALP